MKKWIYLVVVPSPSFIFCWDNTCIIWYIYFFKKWIKWLNSEGVPSFLKFFQNQFSQLFSTQQLALICTIDSKMCMAMVIHGNSIFREWGWITPPVRKKYFFFLYNNFIQQYSRRFSYGYLFKRIQFYSLMDFREERITAQTLLKS